MVRRLLIAGLALGPVTIALHWLTSLGSVPEFVLAALALVPLAWVIGEATEHAGDHTGPGIGGFLNATFGNAPELIIALLAVDRGLDEVVRGSLTGSVIGNLLLVLGVSLVAGKEGGELDRTSSFVSFGLIAAAVLLFVVTAVPGWHGEPNRRNLGVLALPIAGVLLVLYIAGTWRSLRRHAELHAGADDSLGAWPLRLALVVLSVATVATALVAEVLVGSLEEFAHRAGLTDFFVAAVIVAIVGNAAEHGGAVIVAYRGKLKLAAEIALSSAAQVAVFVIPAVAILSWAVEPPLALSFRKEELAALAGSLALTVVVLFHGRASRLRGGILLAAYGAVVVIFFAAGDRMPT